jgi:probable selenium-dependent hydroxylase accessory protein YqeC
VLEESADGERALPHLLAEHGHVTLARRRNPDGKLAGIRPSLVDALAAARVVEVIVVEADGSAGRPLKAAREGEPVWPSSSTHSVLVTGVDALGAPLDEAHVFRSALAAEITGLSPGAPVGEETAARLLLGPRGLAAGAPPRSRLLVFVNKVESPAQEASALALSQALLRAGGSRLARVVVGSLRDSRAGFTIIGPS